jgi:4-hydroxy-tetrahydrodipicolinate reductase
MGQAIAHAAETEAAVEIGAKLDMGDAIDGPISGCDVVVDFSHADATPEICRACVGAHKPLVIGTTGHTAEQTSVIKDAAQKVPIILAANFSVGVNTLFWLTRRTAELLGEGFDIEIIETHHRMKKDAPSGTAKRLATVAAEARRLSVEKDLVHGRAGQVGERPAQQIGMHAIRAGDVVGDHTVIFASPGERLELTHKASSRETFAAGALRAAQWIVGKPASLYNMEDVLGLSGHAR